ncbi:MAG TPA: hypothetical protein VK446_04035 [Methylocystis sp.]|nr:hypothetical protein [Methylocystis sp.]
MENEQGEPVFKIENVLKLLVTIVLPIGLYVGNFGTPESAEEAFRAALAREAAQMNKTLPQMVNAYTRLDKATAGPGNSFTYVYTVVDDGAATDLMSDPTKLEAFRSQLRGRVCDVKSEYMEHGTTVSYALRNSAGGALAKISVDPRQCSAPAADNKS